MCDSHVVPTVVKQKLSAARLKRAQVRINCVDKARSFMVIVSKSIDSIV